MTAPRKLALLPVRVAALVVSLLLAGHLVVLADDASWGVVAILPFLLAVEIGRQLWREIRSK